jgi:NADH-quinone oxidoreductase subunit N
MSLLAAEAQKAFTAPNLDYHALAPEIVLAVTLALVLVADLFLDDRRRWVLANLSGIGLLAALVPVVTLALDGNRVRSMVGGAYVVDDFSLVL